jgi:Putative metallopeptidase
MDRTAKHILICVAASLLLAGVSGRTMAADEDEKWDFVWNTAIHVMHHEIGHALVDQFAIPVIGQEEDAADSYATLAILESYDEPQPILLDTAAAWFAMQAHTGDPDESDYFDEHDLDIQRAYRVVCFAHGYDAETFADVAKDLELPDDRLARCENDASQALDSWDALLADAYRTEDGPGGNVEVNYRPTKTNDAIRQRLEETGILEDIAKWLDETFDLPQKLTINAADCGEANAYYYADDVSVTFCYEFAGYLRELADTALE